jgi:hypothetical protein
VKGVDPKSNGRGDLIHGRRVAEECQASAIEGRITGISGPEKARQAVTATVAPGSAGGSVAMSAGLVVRVATPWLRSLFHCHDPSHLPQSTQRPQRRRERANAPISSSVLSVCSVVKALTVKYFENAGS